MDGCMDWMTCAPDIWRSSSTHTELFRCKGSARETLLAVQLPCDVHGAILIEVTLPVMASSLLNAAFFKVTHLKTLQTSSCWVSYYSILLRPLMVENERKILKNDPPLGRSILSDGCSVLNFNLLCWFCMCPIPGLHGEGQVINMLKKEKKIISLQTFMGNRWLKDDIDQWTSETNTLIWAWTWWNSQYS